jgi:hypothetical protein
MIETYWFGHIVVDKNGVALSKAFKDKIDAIDYLIFLKRKKAV